jgi:hypothetical protein
VAPPPHVVDEGSDVVKAALAAALVLCSSAALTQQPPPGPPPGGPPGMPPMPPPELPSKVVLGIDDAGVHRNHIAGASVSGKTIDARTAQGIVLRSTADHVNGLYVHGKARFTLRDSAIELSGRGKNDFDGIAAGVLAKDEATLELRKVRITTRGIVSSAVTATDKTTLKVHDSVLKANGGSAPSGYVRKIGPGMMEPPTPLGIVGTARTTLTMGAAKAYYYKTKITADGWGAMSTDAAHGAYLEVNDSDIVVRRSGYGTYADHGASVVINRSRINVATFGGIIAGEASLALNGVSSVSRGNSVMIHSVMGRGTEVGTLTIKGGSLRSTNAAILVKSANAQITIDGAKLKAGNGDLLLGVVNDDNFRSRAAAGVAVPGITATIKNAKLHGNVLMQDGERKMNVAFIGSTIKGAIQDATVSFDARSRWIATANSKVSLRAPFDLARVDAPAGVTIEALAQEGVAPKGQHKLAAGGTLMVK